MAHRSPTTTDHEASKRQSVKASRETHENSSASFRHRLFRSTAALAELNPPHLVGSDTAVLCLPIQRGSSHVRPCSQQEGQHKRMRRPGIEPGASRWQRDILPLNQRRLHTLHINHTKSQTCIAQHTSPHLYMIAIALIARLFVVYGPPISDHHRPRGVKASKRQSVERNP